MRKIIRSQDNFKYDLLLRVAREATKCDKQLRREQKWRYVSPFDVYKCGNYKILVLFWNSYFPKTLNFPELYIKGHFGPFNSVNNHDNVHLAPDTANFWKSSFNIAI